MAKYGSYLNTVLGLPRRNTVLKTMLLTFVFFLCQMTDFFHLGKVALPSVQAITVLSVKLKYCIWCLFVILGIYRLARVTLVF